MKYYRLEEGQFPIPRQFPNFHEEIFFFQTFTNFQWNLLESGPKNFFTRGESCATPKRERRCSIGFIWPLSFDPFVRSHSLYRASRGRVRYTVARSVHHDKSVGDSGLWRVDELRVERCFSVALIRAVKVWKVIFQFRITYGTFESLKNRERY